MGNMDYADSQRQSSISLEVNHSALNNNLFQQINQEINVSNLKKIKI